MSQVILHSADALIEQLQGKTVLLVCGRSFDRQEIANEINRLNVVRFSDFAPNPLYEDVCKGLELFRSSGCDAILAVGGGSAIDVAKCIKLFSNMNPAVNYLKQEYADTGIPLAAIPTTAGTGSESTRHAVIYFEGEKQSISHPSIVPDYACLIPSVLTNLPDYQKKCTMLDALCQAIESWWSVSSTEESIGYSRMAIEAILKYWPAYINENSPEAAKEILLAANYAGRAINITATTAAHAMSYKLTSLYGIPHGHAVAVCLPEVWASMLTADAVCTDSRGMEHLQQVLSDLPLNLDQFRDLLRALDLEYPVFRDRASELDILAGSVNPIRLKNNPVLLDTAALRAMYERIVR